MKSYLKYIALCGMVLAFLAVSLPDIQAETAAEPVAVQTQAAASLQTAQEKPKKQKKVKKQKKGKKQANKATNAAKSDTAGTAKTGEDNLPIYDPARDAAPSEGLDIVETNFHFVEPLLVRPKTDMIVIHHVGIPDGDTSAAAIHRAHLANGWAGIGYHYVIRKNGVIERGRPLATVGAHAYGENYHTVGINVTGNFDKEVPTDAQMKSLTELVTALCRIYHIDPGPATIVGHRDVNSTDCPGKNLYRLLPQLRDDVELNIYAEKLKGTHLLKLKKYETEKP